ncbi:hypothetical protein SETIT_6G029100v2 [Setaria italica]|uniref:Uncharacterized protein n=1 Tax=Setaria italica TaxID=4555 RepID=A0A368RHM3_SETIT|nr:hypothetical protein SETIT_6G029100v2 [Setaria italica]
MAFPHMPLLVPARPRGNLAYVDMEPGYGPLSPRPSQATRKFLKLFATCFAATVGIGILVCLFVLRYAYHDPELEDNFEMVALSFVALFMMGFGFLIMLEDGEAYA